MSAKEYSGKLVAPPKAAFAVVVARFNEFISSKLLSGAMDAFARHNVPAGSIEVAWVPGSFEIPVVTQPGRKRPVCGRGLPGAVIRGGTDHYQYVAAEVSKGIAAASLASGVPCIFGVLTCDTVEQAVERAGTKAGNKGFDAAVAAIEMANLMSQLPEVS